MVESKAELLLHPIRLRIIQALAGDRRMTAQQLSEILRDVPPATLYRHINKLAGAGLIQVVEQRPIRGAVEKVYAIPELPHLNGADLADVSRDDHLRYFVSFVAALMGSYSRYLSQPVIDLQQDGVGYQSHPIYLTDAEFEEFTGKLRAALAEALAKPPAPGRRRRTLSTVLIPDPDSNNET